MDYKNIWQFANEAIKGTGGFSDGGYLDQFPREDDDSFDERKKVATYINLFASNVRRYTGYLFRNKPLRNSKNQLIKIFLDDCDRSKNSLDVFMSSFAFNAKVRGVGLVLVDMPKELPNSMQEQIEKRAVPYLKEILPENINRYKIDSFGNFEFISFYDVVDESTFEEKNISKIERCYDKTSWRVYKDGEIVESGDHNLGICPVVAFGENGTFPDVGEFTAVANLAKKHYNLKSELDTMLRGQTFSLLTIQGDGEDVSIGVSNALTYAEGTNKPEFIAPPSGPADTYQKEIEKIEENINNMTYNIKTTNQAESGIALEFKFQGLNSSLSNFAMRLEDFELRVFEVVFKFLQNPFDIEITYPKKFNLMDVEKELGVLEEILSIADIPSYKAAKLSQIINNDLNSMSVEEANKIRSEIEDIAKE